MYKIIVLSISCLLLSACASFTGVAPAESSQGNAVADAGRYPAEIASQSKPKPQQAKTAAALQHWQIKGSLGVKTAQDGWSASLNWKQTGDHYTIRLFGPVGVGSLKISGTPGRVTYINSESQRFTASSAEQLLAEQTGMSIPISNMAYWARGIPVPGIAARTRYDQYHRLVTLAQQGWVVQFLGYSHQKGLNLPTKMTITHPDLDIRLVFSSWSI